METAEEAMGTVPTHCILLWGAQGAGAAPRGPLRFWWVTGEKGKKGNYHLLRRLCTGFMIKIQTSLACFLLHSLGQEHTG